MTRLASDSAVVTRVLWGNCRGHLQSSHNARGRRLSPALPSIGNGGEGVHRARNLQHVCKSSPFQMTVEGCFVLLDPVETG